MRQLHLLVSREPSGLEMWNQREPSGLEMWNRTHTTKSGGYVEGTYTQEFMLC